ncbi:MAG: hypothetical protein Q8N26_10825 [Myxococcales bacterium]|nr:hypothetical protein [Myxococcales bacterium]
MSTSPHAGHPSDGINLVDLALDWAERDHDALREARAGTELRRWQRAPAVTSQ